MRRVSRVAQQVSVAKKNSFLIQSARCPGRPEDAETTANLMEIKWARRNLDGI